ncbi:hypothetical protein [Leptolyngbya sp. KIOST-1]|uniref:hypothetical protein n=1 Tax=Leptolyngbya sp. KIOST-1 TaxID=1229172 RepID=UPI00055DAD5A|nr:hypothetical protein [Leptolyngbya sp. KIOST-1]
MMSREKLKLEIDTLDEAYLDILHRIILAFKRPAINPNQPDNDVDFNPLKGSVLFEQDIISPIDVEWDADQ